MLLMNDSEAYFSAKRIMNRCDELAKISENLDGLTRVYLSPEHMLANECVGKWMQQAGMTIWQDAVGNICGRYESIQPKAPALLLGSHLDTVRNAGRYDGILGVLSAIEVVQWFHNHQYRLSQAIEVIGFCDEEGTRFGITLLGSRGITGTWSPDWIRHSDVNGITLAEAMKHIGLNAEKISEASRKFSEFIAYLELHIEQGPCLEKEDLAVGIVTAINGARRFNCSFTGIAGHAGTLPMMYRNDALVAASEWIVSIERITCEMGVNLLATVGSIKCLPDAANVIPEKVILTLDVRGPRDDDLEFLTSKLLNQANKITLHRKIIFHAEEYYRSSATSCDSNLQKILKKAVKKVQKRTIQLPSGAGHDAVAMAEYWPVGMLFIRNYRGISHNPEESVKIEDVTLALKVFTQAVYDLTI